MNMFIQITQTLRRIANRNIIHSLLRIGIVRSTAGCVYKIINRIAYWEAAAYLYQESIPLCLGCTTVTVKFPNPASYLQFAAPDSEEMVFIAYILKHIQPGWVIYDIGANIGVHTLFFAKNVESVVSFEPFPNCYNRLKDNVDMNAITNVRVCEIALSDSNGTARLSFPAYADNNTSATALASLGKVDIGSDVAHMDVPIATLDTAIDEFALPLPNAIKMDIEGAEYSALIGMEETLRKTHAQLFIEIHPVQLLAMGANEEELYGLLERYGYRYAVIKGTERHSSRGKHIHAIYQN